MLIAEKENSVSHQAIIAWRKKLKGILPAAQEADLSEKDQPDISNSNNTPKLSAKNKADKETQDNALSERPAALQNEITALTLENAILKEKIEVLSRQLTKFRSAIGDLATIDIKTDEQ